MACRLHRLPVRMTQVFTRPQEHLLTQLLQGLGFAGWSSLVQFVLLLLSLFISCFQNSIGQSLCVRTFVLLFVCVCVSFWYY